MAASSDLQALQLQIRNLEQKIDFQHREIKKRDMHIRDLRNAGHVADLERLERSLCRLSLQMEHMQLVIKNPAWSFHTFAMPETTASSAHTIFVRPPSGDRIEVTIPPGKQPGEVFTVMLEDKDAYPPDWPWFAAPPPHEYSLDCMKRKHEATKVLGDIAADFRCSITATLIADPVITADGHLYELAAIAEWLRTRDTSPKTGKRLDSKMLTPSPTVRSATERLVDSGHLPVEEVREWQTRKAAVLINDGRTEDAKAMLLDAKAAGDAGAGLHLGKLFLAEARSLIAEAEAAGVEDAAETLRAHWPSADVVPPGAERLCSVRDVRIGQRVRVLALDIARTAMQSHPCGWNAQMEEYCGVVSKVLKKDDGDGTLQLSNPVAGGRGYWFSVGCCVKP